MMSAPPVHSGVCDACGQPIRSVRNAARHRLFFAVLRPAFVQWPEAHPFRPLNPEHLRSWLLVQAGWCDVAELTLVSSAFASTVGRVLQYFMSDTRVFFEVRGARVRKLTPKSIAFNACREVQFEQILQQCIDIIETVTGSSIDQLKESQNEGF